MAPAEDTEMKKTSQQHLEVTQIQTYRHESANYITSYLSKIGVKVRKEKAIFPSRPSPTNTGFLQIPCLLSDLVYVLPDCHSYFLKLMVGRDLGSQGTFAPPPCCTNMWG